MSWPLASHFSAMLQNPRVAFRDPHLQTCRIETDQRNQPRPWAGAFAVVYKGINANTAAPFAVRVFTTESPERRERYGMSSAYLKGRKLKCLVDFEYRDRSIRSAGDGKWYPLILMEWVQGETLFKWARAQCLRGNTPALAKVAEGWVEVVQELAQASVAHGDLQHANVMVTDTGQIKLVDYDCMCVPGLVGRRNLEIGVEPYQHPGRNETTLLSLDLDDFSALVIHVALRALAAAPQLWQKYIEPTGYDKLLFRPEDFQAPASSALYRDLMNSPQQEVRELTQQLFGLFRARMDQVPSLGDLVDSFGNVEELLRGQQWEAAVEALNRRGHFRDAPAHLKPLINQAYEYVCRKQAWETFCNITVQTNEANDRKLVETWNEALFSGYEPAERQRIRVAEARKRVTTLDRLYHRVQQSPANPPKVGQITLAGEQGIVEVADQLPQGYKYSLQARVDQARRRTQLLDRLERALRDQAAEAAVVAAWRAALDANCEGLVPPAVRQRIELAERRAPVLKKLHEIPPDLPPAFSGDTGQRDRRILEVWQDDLLRDCPEARRWRPTYEEAAARKGALDRLEAAIAAGHQATILQMIEAPLLADYAMPQQWRPAIEAARNAAGQADSLLRALRDEDRAAFGELFDAGLIRRSADRFAPYEALLTEWTVEDVLPLEELGLAAKPRPRVLQKHWVTPVKDSEGDYRIHWTWPPARFADQCLLVICPDQPRPEDDPECLRAHYREPVGRQQFDADGGSRLVHAEPEWIGGHVAVWAVVDLGLRTFYGGPLQVGRLEARSRWSLFSWNTSKNPRRSNQKGLRGFRSRRGEDAAGEP